MDHRLAVVVFLLFVLVPFSVSEFTVTGNKVFYNGEWVRFKGIGLTCTEYMLKPGMDNPGTGGYYGQWAYQSCFGGPSSSGGSVSLNSEIKNVLQYLTPGTHFKPNPTVIKVNFSSPYDQVIDYGYSKVMPIVRVPMAGSCYLYDIDTDTNDAKVYQEVIDQLVTALTSQKVTVVLDLHWNCPDSTKISGCQGAQAAMAFKKFGPYPGALTFWDTLSKKYGSNELVAYELYNEPWIMNFDQWYGGDNTYAGMKEMYDTVRKNAPKSLVIIGGKDQYALDAQSGLAYTIKYKQDTGSYPTNIIWNIHPYVGAGQGLEHSLRSAMRLALALKTVGPVILTEFGQYCCGSKGTPCQSGSCSDHLHGDNFVYNVANLAEQYDLSWIGWAWRGTNINNSHRPCQDGMAECNQPDMRDTGGVLTDATHGGADWQSVWNNFVSPSTIKVNDVSPGNINKNDPQPAGFLPRPCIVGQFNLGDICGYDLSVDVRSLNYQDIIAQSLYDSILPGMPPKGNCTAQGCEGYPCQTYTGPCKKK
eukprot:TRINITY_DN1999_c0_g1_i1.p1 TRINITY_DN1999_c0_g1~~TRINITY_DN1999_c0_g1_i1.p1  ORF type:complete len:541 (+),score=94.32 TRINITY_DN1999_c0_g1_i1:32-1624(+)